MSIERVVNERKLVINTGLIEVHIKLMEQRVQENGSSSDAFPEIYGTLRCFRDIRKYDPKEIESNCLGDCVRTECIPILGGAASPRKIPFIYFKEP